MDVLSSVYYTTSYLQLRSSPVSLWVCLGVKLPLRQVALASWFEQVYRLCSHQTDLCTWPWTRHWWVKLLSPFCLLLQRLFLVHYPSLSISFCFQPPSSSPPFFPFLHQHRTLHRYIRPLPCGFFFVLVSRHRWHPHKHKHTHKHTAMHDQTNSVECRRLMGE